MRRRPMRESLRQSTGVTRVQRPTSYFDLAVDDLPATIVKDRDDAMAVEKTADGYRVHVAVADVAGHIPADSPLGKMVGERGWSVYLKSADPTQQEEVTNSYIPILPRDVEARIELRQGAPRLALSHVIDLDNDFRVKSVRFERVITEPENLDYAQANQRLQEDRKELAEVAAKLKEAGEAAESWKAEIKTLRSDDPHRMRAQKVVETFMLLTNQATAHFFAEADLPFAYRNFDGSHSNAQGQPRAFYSTIPTYHMGFSKDKPYAHVTSPLRRGADFFCQQQIHYTIDVIQAMASALHIDEAKLWDCGPKLFAALQHGEGEAFLKNAFKECNSTHIHAALHAANAVPKRVDVISLSDTLRAMNEQDDILAVQSLLAQVDQVSDASFAHMNEQGFSAYLRKAARLSDTAGLQAKEVLSDAFFDELCKRIETNNIQLDQDALSIVAIAKHHSDARWQEPKKLITHRLKNNHMAINNVFDMLTQYGVISDTRMRMVTTHIPVEDIGEETGRQLAASIVALQRKDGFVAPQDYSIGKTEKSARTHGKYSFIEHFGFNDLSPVTASRLPNQFYEKLNDPDISRESILRSIVEQHHGKISISSVMQIPTRFHAQVKVYGAQIKPPIVCSVVEESRKGEDPEITRARARDKTIHRMLRNERFKSQFALTEYVLPATIWDEQHQMAYLQQKAEQKGWSLSVRHEEVSRKQPVQHCTYLRLYQETTGELREFSATAPNVARADNAAAQKALEEMGWNRNIDAPLSWVREATRPEVATLKAPANQIAKTA